MCVCTGSCMPQLTHGEESVFPFHLSVGWGSNSAPSLVQWVLLPTRLFHRYLFKISLGISEKHHNELNEYFSFHSFWHTYLCVVCVLMCIHGHMCVGTHV